MAEFDPEKMAAYRLARRHSRAVRDLISRGNARGHSDLVVQLRRSTTSIPANLLEATGDWRPRKKLNYFLIAKGSTLEAWSHTDSLVDFGVVEEDHIGEARDLQRQVTALLITMVRNLESELAARRRDRPPK